jgi:lipopolysaccharide transport system permease protein
MPPHSPHSCSPLELTRTIRHHQHLIWQLTRREIIERYQGSIFGLFWSFFNPLLMLSVYTFVFSVIFNMRWNISEGNNTGQFALILFIGVILHTLLAECLTKSPLLITGNVNYVKRVVFPLELLPVISLTAALFHALISFIVLLAALLITQGSLHWTILLLPITILPFLVLILGISFLLSAFGVYLQDIKQIISMLIMILMFLAPIFYPISMIPEALQPWIYLNPLTLIVEHMRTIIIIGDVPNFLYWAVYLSISTLLFWAGFCAFQKMRKGFSDAL